MKDIKLVTVIVTYNGAQWIQWCLDSLISSKVATEIVVVDNNSSDQTIDIIKLEYPQVILIQENRNLGFGKANNIGMLMALNLDADYIFLLNQDAKVEPDTLGRLIEVQSHYKNYGIVSPVHFNGFGTALDTYFLKYLLASNIDVGDLGNLGKPSENTGLKRVYPVGFVNAAAWLISRECLETVGGFDPLFDHYGEDNNYLNRIHYHDFEVGIIPGAIMYHDRGNRGGQNSKNPFAKKMDVFRRSLLINALNPNGNKKIDQIKRQLRARKWKSYLQFDRENFRLQNDIFKEFTAKFDRIHQHFELSKKRGRTYLN